MKTNPLIAVLLGVLIVGAFVTFGLAVGYERNFRRLRTLQAQAAAIQNTGVAIKSLADDSVEYSKRNPAITPILQRVGALQAKSAPPPAAKTPIR